MNISKACLHILKQLASLVDSIDVNDFTKPSLTLNGATIGQHIRHTLEFFICFEQGCNEGSINYDKRAHNKLMETDKAIALERLQQISHFIRTLDPEKSLKLEVGYDIQRDESVTVETNALRELVYNIEHAVHHMAIIKIGINEVAPYVMLPFDFGVAASTLRYKKTETTGASSLH